MYKNSFCANVEGSVVNFTNRFIVAVISIMGKRYLAWPTENQRDIIKSEILEEYGFPSCVGFIDGSLIPLAYSPSWSHQDFYSRKGFYAISCQIVCDHNKRITHLHSGFAGGAHDMRVYNASTLYTKPSRHFQGNEYLLADSAYAASLTVLPVFKKPSGSELSRDLKHFNYRHAQARVNVENTIGMIKSRFQSLRGLRVPIRKRRDVRYTNHWIKTCCVLHNFLLDNQDEPDEEWFDESDLGSNDAPEDQSSLARFIIDDKRTLSDARSGAEKRAIVKRIVNLIHDFE